MKLSFPTIVDKISTLKDRTVKLSLVTQELPPEEMAIIFGLSNKLAVCVLAAEDTQIDEKDLDIPLDYPKEKSPSKRLKDVIWRLWEQGGKQGEFELYYRRSMERFIDIVKEKLT